MTDFESKLLGEKLHNYCSSSDEDEPVLDRDPPKQTKSDWDGTSTNTGPKGVLNDWEQFKKQQKVERIQKEKDVLKQINDIALTCKSELDDLDDQFLVEYRKKRMKEMLDKVQEAPIFNQVHDLLNGDEFLNAVENEIPFVTVIIHVYEPNVKACSQMNTCFQALCREYEKTKFCKIIGSSAGLSLNFKMSGVPAILAYRAGQLIGNFVRITDELGFDFYVGDVENFLIEHGVLLDKSCIPSIITNDH
ncbi:phosducin-like protein [Daktulosphaira vitifoliae]|uniref:phosducin-like protein n=1 Tax=Daktulosphaira vitifoliae TaxID=58002 RepID=UPI0021AA50DF|nr:phosducin-like protein [Daktulosphaira vitifoliae]